MMSEKNDENLKRIYCQKCKYYYVTWDNQFPNGCKLYGIKSKQLPSLIVYQSVGSPCDKFTQR